MDKSENKADSFPQRFLEATLVGAFRGIVGLPIEQPLDRIKTTWQAKPEIPSLFKVTQEIFHKEGIRGFYEGGLPNGVRLASKQVYRFPIILSMPSVYDMTIPSKIRANYPDLETIITGLILAKFETFVITPMERLKVWKMTNPDKTQRLRDFFRSKEIATRLYAGWRPTYMKLTAGWLSFLLANDKCKGIARKYQGTNSELSLFSLFLASVPIAALNTLSVMPFDVVKTHFQKKDAHSEQKIIPTMAALVKKHGFAVLFTGWKIRFGHALFQAAITVPMLDKVQEYWKKRQWIHNSKS